MNELEFAKKLAIKGGEIIAKNFSKENNIFYKDHDSKEVLTSTDIAVEHYYIKEIEKSRFNFPIFEEEGRFDDLESDFVWVFDPVDGTTNFSQGIPHFCTSVALVSKGKSILGVVYDPFKKELFWAEKGKGAFLNSKKIAVSQAKKLSDSVACVDNSHYHSTSKVYSLLLPRTRAIRQLGAGALDICYVAAGRLDAYACTTANKITAWDFAAAGLILEEAGGRFTDFSGKKWSLFMRHRLASNSKLHSQLLSLFRKH